MITIYGIKNCDTVKKALKWLKEFNIDYQFHDYKKDGIGEVELKNFIKEFGLENVVNRKGTTWRKLSDDEKEKIQDINSAIKLIKENTSIIKRPIIAAKSSYLIGFNENEYISKLIKS